MVSYAFDGNKGTVPIFVSMKMGLSFLGSNKLIIHEMPIVSAENRVIAFFLTEKRR
jgi:hypothetical protein